MRPRGGKKRRPIPWIPILWLIIFLLSIQAYLVFKKKNIIVENKPLVIQPVVKPAKPVMTVIKPVVVKRAAPVGRIAVVIDDWGYNNSHCKYLALMPAPAGIAVLPGLSYSRDIIDCALKYGKEPMLHLPLEPYSRKEIYKDGYVLTTDMDAVNLKKVLVKILSEMHGVVGVNNHTGSKGSESELIMTTVLSEVKKRGLFYVDSVTSDKSVGAKVAEQLKTHIAKRNVFLDNRNERAYITNQFDQAANIARKKGFALVIGHDRLLTLQIIIDEMSKLTSEGFEFVTVADYIKRNEYPRY